MTYFPFDDGFQSGSFEKGAILAVRSGDSESFWMAECVEKVKTEDVRWSVQYFCLVRVMSDESNEYRRDTKCDMIWRDVVLSDISAFVRAHDRKLVLPTNIKSQLCQDDLTDAAQVTSSGADQPLCSPLDVICIEDLAAVIGRTRTGQNMVS